MVSRDRDAAGRFALLFIIKGVMGGEWYTYFSGDVFLLFLDTGNPPKSYGVMGKRDEDDITYYRRCASSYITG